MIRGPRKVNIANIVLTQVTINTVRITIDIEATAMVHVATIGLVITMINMTNTTNTQNIRNTQHLRRILTHHLKDSLRKLLIASLVSMKFLYFFNSFIFT